MANRERGEVEVVLDGKPYTWRLTTNAACALETRTGQKFLPLMTTIEEGSLQGLRDFVWLALQASHTADFPTVESAGDFIDRIGIVTAMEKFRELLEVNQPRADAQAENPQMPTGTGAGSTLRAVG